MIMDKLGLEVTRTYNYLLSFDSSKFKCLGLIKDLVISLAHIPTKTIFMDVFVADIPLKFGILLSRSWADKLKVTIQMDISYATIPVFGVYRIPFIEKKLAYYYIFIIQASIMMLGSLTERITCTTINTRDKRHKEFSLGKP